MKQLYLYIKGLSDFGSRMHFIAVTALILSFENAGFWLMAFFISRQLGGILSSLYAGTIADRFDRRHLMMGSDLGSGLAIITVVLFPNPLTVVVSAFIVGVLYSLFQVSFDASIPHLFGDHRVVKINATIIRIGSIAGIVGFLVGGLLADHWGYRWVLLFDAVTFIISAWVLWILRWDSQATPNLVPSVFSQEIREAFQYIHQHSRILVPSILVFFYAIAISAWNFGLPILAHSITELSSTLNGLMWSVTGIGSLIGAWWLGGISLKQFPAMVGSLMVMALFSMLVFWADHQAVILLLLFLVGFADAGFQVFHRVLIQQSDNNIRGRVLGFQQLLSRGGYLVGFLLAPVLTHQLSLPIMVMILEGMVFFATAWSIVKCIQGEKKNQA
ncbi:MFS transporter [Ammoniphilus sp. YIM 78166]|uniref:MFS transporter n=1 Tax=Ammoniphilus sp. YIM 78166 TaxID=1644106 RepID=UPI00106F82ED|nr:MFS transporter [Ammoniphilus sp. YIM 78166]